MDTNNASTQKVDVKAQACWDENDFVIHSLQHPVIYELQKSDKLYKDNFG